MKTSKHILVYDDTCPMCAAYTRVFVKTGLLTHGGRQAFSRADTTVLGNINLDRGKNEIPLLNTQTQQVYYGIDAMLEVLGEKLPLVKTVGHWRPVYWFLRRLYKLITYNRRVIVAPEPIMGNGIDCAPDFNAKYRNFFMVFMLLLNTALILPLHNNFLSNTVFSGLTYNRLLLGHGLLAAIHIGLARLLRRRIAFEYLGQVTMLATLFFLLCIPVALVNYYTGLNNVWVNTVWIGVLGGLITKEYVRRMRYAAILPDRRWMVWADVMSIALFFIILVF